MTKKEREKRRAEFLDDLRESPYWDALDEGQLGAFMSWLDRSQCPEWVHWRPSGLWACFLAFLDGTLCDRFKD